MTPLLRVAVVDDSAVLRTVLSKHLDGDDRLEVVRQFADTAGLVEALADDCPDVLVLDNQMPGGDGVDALPAIRQRCPDSVIVMWSSDDGALRDLALERGADHFVDKGEPLASVVRAALAGPRSPA